MENTLLTAIKVTVFLIPLVLFEAVSVKSLDTDLPPYYLIRNELRSRPELLEKVPPGGGTKDISVNVYMIPADILDVDDVRQVVSASVLLQMSWKDSSLSWDMQSLANTTSSNESDIPKFVTIPVNEIWIPDVLVLNGARTDQRMVDKFSGDRAKIGHDGLVSVTTSPTLDLTCRMDLSVYPFDTQNCRLVLFLSSTVPIQAMDVYGNSSADRGDLQKRLSVSAEWNLQGQTVTYLKMDEFVYIQYIWTLKRKTTYYVISFVVPTVLTSYMNTLVFVMPAGCGERISYLVSIFVSNAVFVSFCTDGMPQNSIPVIMYLVLGTMTQSAVLIVVNSLILRRFHSDRYHVLAADQSSSRTGVSTAANLHDSKEQTVSTSVTESPGDSQKCQQDDAPRSRKQTMYELPSENTGDLFQNSERHGRKRTIFKMAVWRVLTSDHVLFIGAFLCNTAFLGYVFEAIIQ